MNGKNIQVTIGQQVAREPARHKRRKKATKPYEKMKGVWNVFANRLLSRYRSQDKHLTSFILSCIFKDFWKDFETNDTFGYWNAGFEYWNAGRRKFGQKFFLKNKEIQDATRIREIDVMLMNSHNNMEIGTVYCVHEEVYRRNWSENNLDWNLIRKIVIGEECPTLNVVECSYGDGSIYAPDNYFALLLEYYRK
jgi:hypothetical protein